MSGGEMTRIRIRTISAHSVTATDYNNLRLARRRRNALKQTSDHVTPRESRDLDRPNRNHRLLIFTSRPQITAPFSQSGSGISGIISGGNARERRSRC